MPTYLCHGFRWQRRSVRVYVVVQNLDDASPEWIIPAKSSQCLLESFYNLFDFLPYCVPPPRSSGSSSGSGGSSSTVRTGGSDGAANSDDDGGNNSRRPAPAAAPLNAHGAPAHEDELGAQAWSAVKLLEEYDPLDLESVSRPHAYVADYAVRIDLSASVADEMARYEARVRADRHNPPVTALGLSSDEGGGKRKGGKKQGAAAAAAAGGTGWFERLRDQLQRGEEIRWYVVVNGDEVRDWPDEPVRRRTTTTRAEDGDGKRVLLRRERTRDKGRSEAPPPPREQLPPLKTKASVDGQGGLRPKTPGKGGFRRLFGRGNKGLEETSP